MNLTKKNLRPLSWPGVVVLLSGLTLSGIGVLTVAAAEGQPNVPLHAGWRQASYVVMGLLAAIMLLRFGYQRLGRWAYLLYGVALLLLVPLVVARLVGPLPGVPRRNGTYRWIDLPLFDLQPSELMKIGYIVALAWYLRFRENYRYFSGLIGPFVMTVIPMFLILLQPDLGTVLLLMPVLFVMLFSAGARWKHLGMVAGLAIFCIPIFWSHLEDYQRMRIAGHLLQNASIRDRILNEPEKWTWLCPPETVRRWEQDDGYQLIRSKGALGSGGLMGWGWGQGMYLQYDLLPFKHNDFVLSIVGEQWGFLGCSVILFCYLMVVLAGLRLAVLTSDPFGRLLCVGVVALLGTQFLINVGTVLGLTPAKGMTLPFVSYGGSSMISNYLSIGLLMSVSQYRPYLLSRKPFEGLPEYAVVG